MLSFGLLGCGDVARTRRGARRRRSGQAIRSGGLAAVLVLGMPVIPSAAAAADFTWSGATALGSGASNWSNGPNWVGGTAPSGSVGVLTFPALTSPPCTSTPPTDTCSQGTDDISGLSASGLTIDDTSGYFMQGTQA